MDVTSYLMGRNSSGGSGGGSSVFTFQVPNDFVMTYFGDPTKYGQDIDLTNETHIAFLNQIKSVMESNNNCIVKLIVPMGEELDETIVYQRKYNGEFSGLMFNLVYYNKVYQGAIDYFSDIQAYTFVPNRYTLSN